jgi:hypothetical protein
MPVIGDWKCLLIGSGAGKSINFGTRITFPAFTEHHVVVGGEEEEEGEEVYVEVGNGSLEVYFE